MAHFLFSLGSYETTLSNMLAMQAFVCQRIYTNIALAFAAFSQT